MLKIGRKGVILFSQTKQVLKHRLPGHSFTPVNLTWVLFDFKQYPTKALAPLMLEDYRKVMVDRRGEEELFSSDQIAECMKKGNVGSFFCVRG